MKFNKKVAASLAAGTVLVAGSGVAYAYWTSTGSGSGTAATGTAANNLVVTGTPDSQTLAPNGPGSVVSFTVANPSNFNQKVSKIHLTGVVAYPTATDRTNHTNPTSGCGTIDDGSTTNAHTGDFYMPDVTVASDGDITHGATAQTITETGTIVMNDLATDQGACKGQFLALTFSTT